MRLARRACAVLNLAALAAILPNPAAADIGLPLIAVWLPPLWLGLVPIVAVEALVLARRLAVSFRRAILPAALGNAASAIVGLPLAWIMLASVEGVFFGRAEGLATIGAKIYAVTIQSPWLIPYEDEFRWMLPGALIAFSLPCFLVSVAIEAPVNRLFLAAHSARAVWRATAWANLASYGVLAALIAGYAAIGHRVLLPLFYPVVQVLAATVFRLVGLLTAK